MVDLQDKYTESLFSPQDWTEIKSNLPATATYSKETAEYLDTLEDIVQEQDIVSMLKTRPHDPEKAIVHRCVESWYMLHSLHDCLMLCIVVHFYSYSYLSRRLPLAICPVL